MTTSLNYNQNVSVYTSQKWLEIPINHYGKIDEHLLKDIATTYGLELMSVREIPKLVSNETEDSRLLNKTFEMISINIKIGKWIFINASFMPLLHERGINRFCLPAKFVSFANSAWLFRVLRNNLRGNTSCISHVRNLIDSTWRPLIGP